MRSPSCLLLLGVTCVLAGCVSSQEMDLTFLNSSGRMLYLEAGLNGGVHVQLEVLMDERWVPIERSLGLMCVAPCGGGAAECAPVVPDLPVVHGLRPNSSVTRHLEGDWWYLDEAADCARPAPMKKDLQAVVCFDDVAIDESTGQPFEEPPSSGVLGTEGGAHLRGPECEGFGFHLRQATASTLLVPGFSL